MLALKNYQQRALDALRDYLQLARQMGAKTAFVVQTERPYRSVQQLPGLPYVCIRIPTGGGKTLLACHSVPLVAQELLGQDRSVVLWLVPTNTIKDQTLAALRNRRHPYREALDGAFGGRVEVLDLGEALSVQRSTLDGETTIIVSTLAALRVEDTEGRKVYDANGSLMSHFDGVPEPILGDLDKTESGQPIYSLANVLRLRRPLVIVDEAHNARTHLSFETLARFKPSCILEFTATPAVPPAPTASNVLTHVSAYELKAEHMIKLPIRLSARPDWKEAMAEAIAQRNKLEELAVAERAATGEYIRPIALVQAQPRNQQRETLTVEKVQQALKDMGIPENQIAIETGDTSEVARWEDENRKSLFHEACPIRYIITVAKLREGWDCPFAYVLCSVAEMGAQTAVEQILGRVLRMPKAESKQEDGLNYAYACVTSQRFALAAQGLADALVASGFTAFEAVSEIAKPPQLPFGEDDLGGLFAGPRPAALGEPTPAERREPFQVPQLALRLDGELEPVEESHFLQTVWNLADCDSALTEAEYAAPAPGGQHYQIDITQQGQTRIQQEEVQFVAEMQQQLLLLLPNEITTPAELAVWLDRQIPHPDITQSQTQLFLVRLVEHLVNQRGLTMAQLSRDRLRLREAAARKIDQHRQAVLQTAFQQMLFQDGPTEVEVDAACAFTYDPAQYPASVLYDGPYRFQKHYYRAVGTMNGEETLCAHVIDASSKVKYWVRNLERQPQFSFWLQTATDRFYPDFVVLLEDGCILAVEYKGAHLLTTDDTKEKRQIGELWAARSGGSCLFLLVSEQDYQGRLQSILNG